MKRLLLNLSIALRSLCGHRLRTSLAVLGVFLGTFSLIVVYNISASLAEKTKAETETLGKNIIVITSGIVRRFGAGTRLLSTATTLRPEDAKALAGYSYEIAGAVPAANKAFPVRYAGKTLVSVNIVGVTPNFPALRSFYPERGRFFTEEENSRVERVAVLGRSVAKDLFGDTEPIGKDVLIYRVPVKVIGVMEPKGVDISGLDQDNQIFIPLNTIMRRFLNINHVNSIYLQAREERFLPQAKKQAEELLRIRHGKVDFTVIDMKEAAAVRTQAMVIVSVLGKASSAVSFVIGGIGILSIMILIVNERRLEIGIRRAVGSRKKDIVLQFLLESSFVSVAGGAMGVLVGFLASLIVFKFTAMPFSLSVPALFGAFAISATVGVLAGIYPAKRASEVQPVHIIRG